MKLLDNITPHLKAYIRYRLIHGLIFRTLLVTGKALSLLLFELPWLHAMFLQFDPRNFHSIKDTHNIV